MSAIASASKECKPLFRRAQNPGLPGIYLQSAHVLKDEQRKFISFLAGWKVERHAGHAEPGTNPVGKILLPDIYLNFEKQSKTPQNMRSGSQYQINIIRLMT